MGLVFRVIATVFAGPGAEVVIFTPSPLILRTPPLGVAVPLSVTNESADPPNSVIHVALPRAWLTSTHNCCDAVSTQRSPLLKPCTSFCVGAKAYIYMLGGIKGSTPM